MKKRYIAKSFGKVSCITMAAVSCIGLTGCGVKPKEVISDLKNQKYEEALAKYKDNDWSDKKMKELKSELSDYLAQIVTDYAADKITYEQVTDTVATISNMQISDTDEDIALTSASIKALYSSKQAYKAGIEWMEKKVYAEAIECFGRVIEDDCNYESAKEKIAEATKLKYEKEKTDMYKSVEDYLKAGDYASAISSIETFKKSLKEEDAEVNKFYEDCVKEFIDGITKKVDEALKKKDYKEAFDNILDAQKIIVNDEIKAIYEKIKNEYVTMITEKVEALINEKEYMQAINILNNTLISFEEFGTLMERINQEKPVYLSELKYQSSSQYQQITEGEGVTDTLGNKYMPDGNLYEMTNTDDGWNEHQGNVDYYLGYGYNKIHFNVAVDDVSNDISSVLTVYGDDVVLYTLNLNRKTVPTEVVIDVSKVNYLSIKMSGVSDDGSVVAIISNGYFE